MKNEYQITKKLIMSWAREYHLFGAANIFLFVLWCAIGLFGLLLVALMLIVGGHWLYWYCASLMILITVYKLFLARFVVWSRRYKMMASMYGVSEWIRSIEFTPEEIVLTDHTTVQRFKYESIRKIKKKGNVIMIYLDHGLALRLYEDAFITGSWAECKQLLEQNTKQ
ncbi:MAG: hypothetical protein E7581_00875 [Ruminococcaceae bacterium]|nr:hypothetical protein [Oscillospiraceae bacterium]